MNTQWLMTFLVGTLVAVSGYEISDEQYYDMPSLFHLDDYEECFTRKGAAFCLGSFDLLEHDNLQLMQVIRNVSEDKYNFNHTHIHRGLCLNRCTGYQGSLRQRFEQCVDNLTSAQYGLQTNLTKLEYCTAMKDERTVDSLDVAFAWVCAAIVLFNMVGTAYDVLRTENKPNKFLISWSLCASWRRLTAVYSDGDPRLAALRPIQGMKALTLLLVILVHSVLAFHVTYILNPLFVEKMNHHPLITYFESGTSVVHTFIMASSFLLAYNLLLDSENNKRTLSLAMFPKCLLHRITRIFPVYIFFLGMTVTWWVHASTGPLWGLLVGGECARCRDKWWTHVLFINNLVKPGVKCVTHTWYLAAEMQLYIVCSILTLLLGSRPRLALKVLPCLLCLAVAGNFTAAYLFDLRPMVMLMFPESMRILFGDDASFTLLYQAPWDSLPAALVGLFVAFLHYQLQSTGYKPADSLIIRLLYRISVPLMFLWVIGGYFIKGVTDPVYVSLYAALDRPVFISITTFAMFGFINKIDSLWWRFLSWRGWEILGRMSLSIYLVHWLMTLTFIANRPHLSYVSIPEIVSLFLWTVFASYSTAVPLHLFIELPMQRFLQALFT